MSEQGMFCFDVSGALQDVSAQSDRPAKISERFHDVLVQHRNGIAVSGPAEEKLFDQYFNGLIDALEAAGLGDQRRKTTTRKK